VSEQRAPWIIDPEFHLNAPTRGRQESQETGELLIKFLKRPANINEVRARRQRPPRVPPVVPYDVWCRMRISQLTTVPARPTRPGMAEDAMPGWSKPDMAWQPASSGPAPEDAWLNGVSVAQVWTGDLPRTSSLDQLVALAQRLPDEDTLEVPAITRRRLEGE